MAISLELRNYRCFRRVDWSPCGVCVVVGANGAGKTTLLSSFDFLRNVYRQSLGSALYFNGGAWGVRNLLAPLDEHVSVSITVGELSWQILPGVESQSADGEFGEIVAHETTGQLLNRSLYSDKVNYGDRDWTVRDSSALRKVYEAADGHELDSLVDAIVNFRVYSDYRLYQLRQQGSRNQGDLYLSRGGENLFCVLRNWRDKRSSRESYDLVLDGMREAFPDYFENWEFEVSSQNVSLQFLLANVKHDIPVSLMPDGLLVGLLHLTAIAGANPGTLVCLDEMENALHPYAIRSLTSTIREIANKRNLTVVLSTHSPVLLDQFRDEPASVYVLGSDADNEVTPLSELRDPDWLAHFSLGALYAEQEFGARKKAPDATTS